MIVALYMEANQVRLTVRGIDQPSPGKVTGRWIDVIQDNVLNWGCNHTSTLDFLIRQQEHRRKSHKVLHILESKCGLNGDIGVAQIIVQIKHIHKSNHVGYSAMNLLKFVDNPAFCHSQCPLPGGFRTC